MAGAIELFIERIFLGFTKQWVAMEYLNPKETCGGLQTIRRICGGQQNRLSIRVWFGSLITSYYSLLILLSFPLADLGSLES
jgi:hypothetical protein